MLLGNKSQNVYHRPKGGLKASVLNLGLFLRL